MPLNQHYPKISKKYLPCGRMAGGIFSLKSCKCLYHYNLRPIDQGYNLRPICFFGLTDSSNELQGLDLQVPGFASTRAGVLVSCSVATLLAV